MKLFALFYYATLVFIASVFVQPAAVYFGLDGNVFVRYEFLLDYILMSLILTGPIVMLRRLGTALWVRLLFLPFCVASWFLVLLSFAQLVDLRLVEKVGTVPMQVLFFGGCVLFVGGCWCVRAPMVRNLFRVQGVAIVVVVAFGFWILSFKGLSDGRTGWLLTITGLSASVALGVAPLLVLYYRYWRRGGEEKHIVAAVEALGV